MPGGKPKKREIVLGESGRAELERIAASLREVFAQSPEGATHWTARGASEVSGIPKSAAHRIHAAANSSRRILEYSSNVATI